MKRYFVTGIGTSVGKTLVSAILTEALQADYWKPVQTGMSEDCDKNTIASLISNSKTIVFNEACVFQEPASPHLAAALENTEINPNEIKLPDSKNDFLIIEGAGGLLVPLNSKDYVIDLAKRFDAEVILVCRNYLGCINHSLLSIDYLLKNNFKIKGLILNDNFDLLVRKSIADYAKIPILAEIHGLPEVSKQKIKEAANFIDTSLF